MVYVKIANMTLAIRGYSVTGSDTHQSERLSNNFKVDKCLEFRVVE